MWTGKEVREALKTHVNLVVNDTIMWEQSAAYLLDTHPVVSAFIKNFGLNFTIPYAHNGEPHDYLPDFVARLEGDAERYLIVEIKGQDWDGRTEIKRRRRGDGARRSMRPRSSALGNIYSLRVSVICRSGWMLMGRTLLLGSSPMRSHGIRAALPVWQHLPDAQHCKHGSRPVIVARPSRTSHKPLQGSVAPRRAASGPDWMPCSRPGTSRVRHRGRVFSLRSLRNRRIITVNEG